MLWREQWQPPDTTGTTGANGDEDDMAKSRSTTPTDDQPAALAKPEEAQKGEAPPSRQERWERAKQLGGRAQDGDEAAMEELRALMRDDSKLLDLPYAVIETLVAEQLKAAFGQDLLMREGMEQRMRAMRKELAAEGNTPLERLLIDRIVVCWLQVQHADHRYASLGNCSIVQGDYFQRFQDRAHRRFLSACKALAVVRRLAIPALQVNIGEKQVNIATANAAAAGTAAPAPPDPGRLPDGEAQSETG